jgi:hypothetical protein
MIGRAVDMVRPHIGVGRVAGYALGAIEWPGDACSRILLRGLVDHIDGCETSTARRLNYWLKNMQKAGHAQRGAYLVKAVDRPFLVEQATKGLEGWEPSHFLDVANNRVRIAVASSRRFSSPHAGVMLRNTAGSARCSYRPSPVPSPLGMVMLGACLRLCSMSDRSGSCSSSFGAIGLPRYGNQRHMRLARYAMSYRGTAMPSGCGIHRSAARSRAVSRISLCTNPSLRITGGAISNG